MAAHGKSIIHRDLKPENIFVLEKDGAPDFVKIVDFGIAKDVKAGKRLTAIGMVLGTPEYMSPEQATGQESDHRVDQYALGCILYEMLTGDVPFKGENAPKTLTKHVFDPVVPPSKLRPDLEIPLLLEEIVMRMLQKAPGDRFSDMRALIDAFEAALTKIAAGQAPGRKTSVDGPVAMIGRARPTAPPMLTDAVDALPRNKAPIYVAVVVSAAALAVLVAVAVTRLGHKPAVAAVQPPATAPQPATPPPTAPVAPPPTAPSPPAEVQIQITTEPPGAELVLGTEPLGVSPADVRHVRAADPVMLTIRHAGFKEEHRPVSLDHDQTLEIVLQPKHDKVAVRSARPPKATHPQTQPAAPDNKPPHHVSDLRNPFE
jgi:serine/threonine-protein kinase